MGKVAEGGPALHNNRELSKGGERTPRCAEMGGSTMNDKEHEDHDAHVRTRWMIERLRELQRVNLEFTPPRPDDEVKMAVHFAHDVGDAAHIAKVKAQKIKRIRGGESFEQPRWTENDQKERGDFPADLNAFGNVESWIDMFASEALRANPQLTLEAARAAAREALMQERRRKHKSRTDDA
jgi:hypothetical protein